MRPDLPVRPDLPDRKARRETLDLQDLLVPTEWTVSRVPWGLLVLPVNVVPKGSRVRRDPLVLPVNVVPKGSRVRRVLLVPLRGLR